MSANIYLLADFLFKIFNFYYPFNFCLNQNYFLYSHPKVLVFIARVAELVDALVSNTSGSDTVPVRSRPRVQT